MALVQSVELLLDDHAEAAVRAQWAALQAAHLPSQAANLSPSNRPHVTVVANTAVAQTAEPALRELFAGALPLPVRLGPLMVFGHRRHVLVRLVVPSVELLQLQQDALALAGAENALGTTTAPGRWVPHVTLARRMTADQVGHATELLGRFADAAASVVAARRWDSDARREWPLTAVSTRARPGADPWRRDAVAQPDRPDRHAAPG